MNKANWTPYNKAGTRINVDGRTAKVVNVLPPSNALEVERVTVQFEDDGSVKTVSLRGIRIGSDWIR